MTNSPMSKKTAIELFRSLKENLAAERLARLEAEALHEELMAESKKLKDQIEAEKRMLEHDLEFEWIKKWPW